MAARKQNSAFGFLTEKRETYHRDVAGERADRARAAKQEKQRAAEKSRQLLEELKDDAHAAGADDKRAGKKVTPYRLDLLTSPRYEAAFGKRRARELVAAAYAAGHRGNPAESLGLPWYRTLGAEAGFEDGFDGSEKRTRQGLKDQVGDVNDKELSAMFAGYASGFAKGRNKAAATHPHERYRMKRNPVDAAAALSEAWHGRPAETATDYVEKIRFHGVLMDAGRLLEIKVYTDSRHTVGIEFDESTRLASNEAGEQLYVVGGDQSLSLGTFGIEGHAAKKDLVVVGTVYSVTYQTAKMHLGKQDKIPGPYEHIFQEHDQEEPELLYDTMNQHVGFAGGEYHIDIDIDGKYSAGIRD